MLTANIFYNSLFINIGSKMTIFVFILVLASGIALFAALFPAIKKLIKCKLNSNQKIGWAIFIFTLPFLGSIIFMIYHDDHLSPVLRAYY
jgi:hypothetical protein